jgi:coenzyme PQQ precursor peptide PqqA
MCLLLWLSLGPRTRPRYGKFARVPAWKGTRSAVVSSRFPTVTVLTGRFDITLSQIAELRGEGLHATQSPSSNLPAHAAKRDSSEKRDETLASKGRFLLTEEMNMAWTAPVIVEVCVGMEITSYESAEI